MRNFDSILIAIFYFNYLGAWYNGYYTTLAMLKLQFNSVCLHYYYKRNIIMTLTNYIKSIYPDFKIKKCFKKRINEETGKIEKYDFMWYSEGIRFCQTSSISALDLELEIIYDIKYNEKMKKFLTPEKKQELLDLLKK